MIVQYSILAAEGGLLVINNVTGRCRRVFRNQDKSEPVPKILGYFGTIPIYPAPGGRIFGNLQDISEPPSRSLHVSF